MARIVGILLSNPSFIDRRRGNTALHGRGESPLLLFGLIFRIGPENFSTSDGKNQAPRRCSFGGGTLRDCAWRAYKTEDDMGLLRRRPVKREPTCSALRLYSLYSGIPALQVTNSTGINIAAIY